VDSSSRDFHLPLLLFVAYVLPLVVSLVLTALLIRWAPRLGLVDLPNQRKVHEQPTPRGGGLAIAAAVVLTSALPVFRFDDAGVLVGLSLFIALLGLLDDWRPIPWQWRLGIQATAAIAATVVLLGPRGLSYVWWPAAIFWVVGLTNAFNMLDNMDALSSGIAWIAAGCLAASLPLRARLTAIGGPDWTEALPCIILMGAVMGFWIFNRPPARIFMGDAGSTFLGFFLGVYSVRNVLSAPAGTPGWWAVPFFAFFIPWYDLVTVVTIRLSQGRSPFHADKQHLSHRLVELGLSKAASVRVIHAMALTVAVVGLALCALTDSPAILATAIGLAWIGLRVAERLARRLRRVPQKVEAAAK
jgi:UDP-GlcNAc:undecaprenyl-phosphate GlcNAc-1-phosphate transferase